MAHKIQIARAWCDQCLMDCWHSCDEGTAEKKHLGEYNAELWQELTAKGYQVSHRGGVYTFTLYKAAPLAMPLDWQFINDRSEAMDETYQNELINQDW